MTGSLMIAVQRNKIKIIAAVHQWARDRHFNKADNKKIRKGGIKTEESYRSFCRTVQTKIITKP